ncbi:unnamed protein product [Cunninghamella blakesleeana]
MTSTTSTSTPNSKEEKNKDKFKRCGKAEHKTANDKQCKNYKFRLGVKRKVSADNVETKKQKQEGHINRCKTCVEKCVYDLENSHSNTGSKNAPSVTPKRFRKDYYTAVRKSMPLPPSQQLDIGTSPSIQQPSTNPLYSTDTTNKKIIINNSLKTIININDLLNAKDINIIGDLTFMDNVITSGDINVNGNLNVDDRVSCDEKLAIDYMFSSTSNILIGYSLIVNSQLLINGSLIIGSNMSVTDIKIDGNSIVTGNLHTEGNIKSNSLEISRNIISNRNITSETKIYADPIKTVGYVKCKEKLETTNVITKSDIICQSNIDIFGDLYVKGSTTCSDNITVYGDLICLKNIIVWHYFFISSNALLKVISKIQGEASIIGNKLNGYYKSFSSYDSNKKIWLLNLKSSPQKLLIQLLT